MKKNTQKILFVAMANSIHTAKWINLISDQKWGLHLFPSVDQDFPVHQDLKNITVHHSFYGRQAGNNPGVKHRGIYVLFEPLAYLLRKITVILFPNFRVLQLAILIIILRPDVVHAMEIQNAGYLILEVKKMLKNRMPKIILTNFGSDIYLFGKLAEHRDKIKGLLKNVDYCQCESQRDVLLAKKFGFNGSFWPVFPICGGFNLGEVKKLRTRGPVSKRKFIMLKGYQGWSGRALVGLRALSKGASLLKGYTVVIYSAKKDVIIAAELFSEETKIPVIILPKTTPNKKILWYHGHARIYLGLSISDGISTSLLEAIAEGAFPIQSNTSAADEWIVHGKTGFIVPPEDPEIIEKALRRALKEDKLVDQAAILNWKTAKERLDSRKIKKQTVEMYKQILDNGAINL